AQPTASRDPEIAALQDQAQPTASRDPEVAALLKKTMMKFRNLTQEIRIQVPRMRYSKQMLEKIYEVDLIISDNLGKSPSLEDVVNMIFVGAERVCEALGNLTEKTERVYTPKDPPWNIRLEG
ncbi:hypothetical protein HHI36_020115, partial [Cryptolaemus montrouzieri]